jgi:hypothetical protein
MGGEQRGDISTGMGHQEIVTSTTPSLGSASCAKPDGDISTTRGYPACSRSSTVHVVLAPVASLVTVKTVPNARVGLAHIPAGAAAYHVAWPRAPSVVGEGAGAGGALCVVAGVTVGAAVARADTSSAGGGAGAVVVVVVVGGGGGAVVVVVVDDVVVVAAMGVVS